MTEGEKVGSKGEVLAAQRITKVYGRVQALSEVSLGVRRGEVIGLVGDNGAGKSTLLGILGGALRQGAGHILVDGTEARFSSPLDARLHGIETVYQDLSLALDLEVADNFFLGREVLSRGPLRLLGWLDRRAMRLRAERALDELRISLRSPTASCGQLSGGQRQAVAVARAVMWGTKVLLLDEPTAALAVEEQERVAQIIGEIRAKGVAVVLVSHNLPQVHTVTDRIIVLRQGRVVADVESRFTNLEEIIALITGASPGRATPSRSTMAERES